jgi:hypothetical protein
MGILAAANYDTQERAAVRITASLVERNRQVGVLVVDADATIEGSIVRDTAAKVDGRFGDGVIVLANDHPAEVTLIGAIVASNARAGLGSWGATVRFTWTLLSCNAFDLEGEVYDGSPFVFPDSHDNFCGCPAVSDSCNALSAGLAPPSLDEAPMLDPDPDP